MQFEMYDNLMPSLVVFIFFFLFSFIRYRKYSLIVYEELAQCFGFGWPVLLNLL